VHDEHSLLLAQVVLICSVTGIAAILIYDTILELRKRLIEPLIERFNGRKDRG
jgi:hypothetical protein